MQKIKLLLVDDHSVVRQGLRMLLGAEPDFEIVGEATSGRQAYQLVQELSPNVVIMDLAMPLLNGMEATRQIASAFPASKVVALSSYQDTEHVRQALAAGAAGYVLKNAAASDLVEAVREVSKGEAYFSPIIARRIQRMHTTLGQPESEQVPTPPPPVELSRREAEVLQLIAEGFPNKLIADELQLSVKTVEKHRQSLMEKLNLHCIADLVRHAVAHGVIEGVPIKRVLTSL
jgi:DNA-binding NarL/FixJ family response regulator